MKVNIYETVEVSPEQRKAIAARIDDAGAKKRDATREELKSFVWEHGASWADVLEGKEQTSEPAEDDAPDEPQEQTSEPAEDDAPDEPQEQTSEPAEDDAPDEPQEQPAADDGLDLI